MDGPLYYTARKSKSPALDETSSLIEFATDNCYNLVKASDTEKLVNLLSVPISGKDPASLI